MYRKIYFMGIKGVGMATLAIVVKEAGFIVAGSDVKEEFITDKILKEAGIDVLGGFREENVRDFFGTAPADECLMIVTGAHDGFDNVEIRGIREIGDIRVVSHGEAVGLFMSGELFGRSNIEGISVAGAHGKTTISAMITSCLVRLGLDPSYTVGTSEINPIGAAGHYGRGKYFIAEADEYLAELKYDRTPKFLYQHPKYLIINNIDFDHPDFYKNIEAVTDAYRRLLQNIPESGTIIVNGDDDRIKEITTGFAGLRGDALQAYEGMPCRLITYGTSEGDEFIIKNFRQSGVSSTFQVVRGGTDLGEFALSVPGYHNAKNALSVIALLMELGISVSSIQKVLPKFLGSKRRFENVGETASGVQVYDDYAHHPEEIRKTLEAAAAAFPDKKITIVFQAHTYARTRSLLSEFVSSFAGVSELIILPTFASARDSGSSNIEEDRAFVEKIRAIQPNVKLIETIPGVVEYIKKNIGPGSLMLTMGAGDVYKVGEQLITYDL